MLARLAESIEQRHDLSAEHHAAAEMGDIAPLVFDENCTVSS